VWVFEKLEWWAVPTLPGFAESSNCKIILSTRFVLPPPHVRGRLKI
jgi:hypothetical protein